MSADVSAMQAAALGYATGEVFGRPVAVFPVRPLGKRPCTDHGFNNASDDPDQVRRLWGPWSSANIGLPLGPNGLCAVDLDGHEGLAAWAEIELPGPPSCCTSTPGGGAHIIYAVPEGRKPRGTVGVLECVDLRGPGYIVVPPSVRKDGAYAWVVPPSTLAPQPAPEWVLYPPVREKTAPVPGPPREGSHTPYGRAALLKIIDEIADTQEGSRNQTLYSRARRVLELASSGDLDAANALEVLSMAAEQAGLPTREIERTITSAMRGGDHAG